jgi:PEP-CTERM motif
VGWGYKMKRAFLFGAIALASLGSAIAANATTVAFDSFGGGSPLYTVPPGETMYTDFSGGNPGTGTGSLYIPSGQSQNGDQPGSFVAAPYTATGGATGQFFATSPGEAETFTFASDVKDVGLYIGSLDAENVLVIHTTSGDITYTGPQLATVPGAGLPGDGTPTITGSTSNGRFTFVDSFADITGITVSESLGTSSNSFEVAQITTSVPEPSTWAMMGLGFAGLAFAGYRVRRAPVRAVI